MQFLEQGQTGMSPAAAGSWSIPVQTRLLTLSPPLEMFTSNSHFRLGLILLLYGGLCRDQLGDGHSERAATYVVNVDGVEESD